MQIAENRGRSLGHLPQPQGPFCCQQTSSLGPDFGVEAQLQRNFLGLRSIVC